MFLSFIVRMIKVHRYNFSDLISRSWEYERIAFFFQSVVEIQLLRFCYMKLCINRNTLVPTYISTGRIWYKDTSINLQGLIWPYTFSEVSVQSWTHPILAPRMRNDGKFRRIRHRLGFKKVTSIVRTIRSTFVPLEYFLELETSPLPDWGLH